MFSKTTSPAGLCFWEKCSYEVYLQTVYLLIELIFPIRCSSHFSFIRLSPIVLYPVESDAVRLIVTVENGCNQCISIHRLKIQLLNCLIFKISFLCTTSTFGDHSLPDFIIKRRTLLQSTPCAALYSEPKFRPRPWPVPDKSPCWQVSQFKFKLRTEGCVCVSVWICASDELFVAAAVRVTFSWYSQKGNNSNHVSQRLSAL